LFDDYKYLNIEPLKSILGKIYLKKCQKFVEYFETKTIFNKEKIKIKLQIKINGI
jgi:hypothetical protein